jgi:membrane-bound lytic murein transglycosylase MltF
VKGPGTKLAVLVLSALGLSASTSAHAAFPYQACFEVAAKLHQVPLDLLLAVAATESAWNPDARSHANAHGIMQIQWPGTARHLGVTRVAELYNPCLNIELGARYLAELLDMHGGDEVRALASYNYGPGRIARSAELPAGARAYVDTVSDHRRTVAASFKRSIDPELRPGSAHQLVWFASSQRARRYARQLTRQTTALSFSTEPLAAGGHAVTMVIPEAGINSSDAALLKALGLSS